MLYSASSYESSSPAGVSKNSFNFIPTPTEASDPWLQKKSSATSENSGHRQPSESLPSTIIFAWLLLLKEKEKLFHDIPFPFEVTPQSKT